MTITLALDNWQSVTVACIDYSKAFDMFCKSKLLHKVSCFSFSDNLLKWIGDFLYNRTQCVHTRSAISSPKQLTSGIVQGSMLGLLLFLLYVDNVVKLFNYGVVCKLYADNLKLYSIIQIHQDVSARQCSHDTLAAWTSEWQLRMSNTVLCLGH